MGVLGTSDITYGIVITLITLTLYNAGLAIYRLYLHPLAKFPGPKVAAASYWYQFYHDVVCHRRLIWSIQDLHAQYGPIVRFSPNEVHIQDADFYNEIYNNKLKLSKPEGWNVSASNATVAAVGHERHRVLRSALSPFFSKRNIAYNEGQIKNKVDRLIKRLTECKANNEIVRMDVAYMALTMDIITTFAYNIDDKSLNAPDFNVRWLDGIEGTLSTFNILHLFPWIFPFIKALPLGVVQIINPALALMVEFQIGVNKLVNDVLAKNAAGKRVEGTIFQAILDSDLDPKDKRGVRLEEEGNVVVGAGAETTARTLAIITFFLFSDRTKLEKLRNEIKAIKLDEDGFYALAELEQLPYLTACIAEGLRHMTSAFGRFPRTYSEPVRYKQWVIPPGAVFSVTSMVVHTNESIFPKPSEYIPERWIEAKQNESRLERYLVPFGKGPRQCIGINLAWSELYLTLAHIVMKFDFELYETEWERDIKCTHDYFVCVPSRETKGVRVKIVNEL